MGGVLGKRSSARPLSPEQVVSPTPSDIDIAQAAEPQHVRSIARGLGISDDHLDYYGKYKAKVSRHIYASPPALFPHSRVVDVRAPAVDPALLASPSSISAHGMHTINSTFFI